MRDTIFSFSIIFPLFFFFFFLFSSNSIGNEEEEEELDLEEENKEADDHSTKEHSANQKNVPEYSKDIVGTLLQVISDDMYISSHNFIFNDITLFL